MKSSNFPMDWFQGNLKPETKNILLETPRFPVKTLPIHWNSNLSRATSPWCFLKIACEAPQSNRLTPMMHSMMFASRPSAACRWSPCNNWKKLSSCCCTTWRWKYEDHIFWVKKQWSEKVESHLRPKSYFWLSKKGAFSKTDAIGIYHHPNNCNGSVVGNHLRT